VLTVCLSVCTFAQYDPNHFDPNNAAHWYRKAFALYEEPNDIDLDAYIGGKIELTPAIADFLKSQKPVIDLVTKAAQIEHCDWQHEYLANGTFSLPPYSYSGKNIAILLLAYGKYQEDTNPDITINSIFEPPLRLASHIDSNVLIDHLVACAIRSITYDEILKYLNRHLNCSVAYLDRAEMFIRNKAVRPKISYADTMNSEIKFATIILTQYKEYIYNDTYWIQDWGVPVEKLSEAFYKRNQYCPVNFC
jgi:hypothetical protein